MSRPPGSIKPFCKRGHDIAQVGRTTAGTCRVCNNLWRKLARARITGGVSARPIRALIRARVGDHDLKVYKREAAVVWAAYRGCKLESAQARASDLFSHPRISVDRADRWCIALGTHLSLVYPELYLSDEEVA